MKMKPILVGVFLLMVLAACTAPKPTTQTPGVEAGQLTVMTHDSAVSAELIGSLRLKNNVKVNFVSGDAGAALNHCSSPACPARRKRMYFLGWITPSLSRALDNDLFEPYAVPALTEIPVSFKLDPQNRALPIDYGDVCINHDKSWFESKSLPLPQSLVDLTKPIHQGLLVVENPATSSPGLSFFHGERSGIWRERLAKLVAGAER